MPKVLNANTSAKTPLPELQEKLSTLKPGEFITFPQSKAEVLKARENLTRRRHEIPGADDHLEYVEACLVAEASGKLKFVG